MNKAPPQNFSLAVLRNLVELVPIRIFWKDCESRHLGCNALFAHDAGLSSAQELIGKSDFDMVWKDQAELYRADDKLVMETGIPKLGYEEPQEAPDGTIHWRLTSKVPLRDAKQEIIGVLGIYSDITERKHAEQNQHRLARAFRLLSECNTALVHAQSEQGLLGEICRLVVETGSYQAAWVSFAENDPDKSVRLVAQSGFELGYLSSANITWADTPRGQGPTGTAIRTGQTVVDQNCPKNPRMDPWREAITRNGFQSGIGLPLVCKNQVWGALCIYSKELNAFNPEEVGLLEELASNLAYGIEALRIHAEHQEAEKKLAFLAYHDPLTGIPNRLLLRDRFDQALALANRERFGAALFYLDLDNFKLINDSLGDSYGDRLLVQVAERLKTCIRDTDTISRQNGDEFIILLNNVRNPGIIEAIAENITDSFSEPFHLDEHSVNTSISIGISLFPNDGKQLDGLLKNANVALYHAKEAGRNTYRFFSEKMNIDALQHMQLQGQLRNALKKQELLLHYQPQIDIASGRIIGAEALLRWQHPEQGLIAPAKFIPLAERSGLIIPIGEWVLNEACRQAQAWSRIHHLPPMIIAVNLSALQFKRGNLLETVTRALVRSGLPASQLELELTESILLQDMEMVMKTLGGLKAIGVKLSIDDFGTGYSSLSYLQRLDVDKLKIDQSFVRDLMEDADDASIVKAIIQLGQTLQLTTIAEGVETVAQLDILKNNRCDQYQGYLFSRPLPAEEFASLYNSRAR
ncbi:MAG: hypothetical protein H6R07_1386 [Proteobacteria bacterium]|nr:hypothetical protein [Pseudomonadota bacterium]